jgi:hypothetical protein
MPFQIVLKTQNDKNKLITWCTSITPHDQYNAKGLRIEVLANEIQNNDIYLKTLKYDTGTIVPQIWNISD